MKPTVKEIRAMLDLLPDNMLVEFSPITSAYLGASHPLRVSDISFYKGMDFALPSDVGATATIYIQEDRSDA